MNERTFLTAEWRDLVMLNYEVEPALLSSFIPTGTELDLWDGKVFVSLVGFRFLNTKVRGIPIPFHRNFDEVNLRFYVRRTVGDEIRRGVVFIKEIVPRWAIAAVARSVYNERYVALPMSHQVKLSASSQVVEYGWRSRVGWSRISISAEGSPELPVEKSQEEFITEHFWGYSAQTNGTTMEYRVAHPRWRVWSGRGAKFEGDVAELYGRDLAVILTGPPSSAFLAEGSGITVFRGQEI
jgi:uncharacterized protein YqjF (DUF2071 family)